MSAERLPQILEIIERNAQAQARLIGDVLDVSRIITGRLRLNREPVLPQELIERAIENVRPAADAKNIEIRMHADDMSRGRQGDGHYNCCQERENERRSGHRCLHEQGRDQS